ncbi:hypothetical protein CK203_019680 [Vitis vinifera]|uniref:Uncharacterized protein n=1 Tax=Vitis vinifera TaxID=29760 RepID=A0A438CGK8_VITVI|nr:hypothetical protein CK203_108746 [Vitis vinifera]RVX11409.1 hypothetical protein CK203_019680 [Vitis vinifera]
MDSMVKDEKKYDQRFEETMKIFEDGGDQCLQKTIKIKKRPPRIGSGLWGIQQSFLTPEESERLKSGGNEKNVQIWK